MAQVQQSRDLVPQHGPRRAVPGKPSTWDDVFRPAIEQLASSLPTGSKRERLAQAATEYINHQSTVLNLKEAEIGAALNFVQDNNLYQELGYPTMREYLAGEKVANLGHSQLQKYQLLARVMAPPAPELSAPTLGGTPPPQPQLNPQSPRVTLTPEFVAEHGTTKSYMLAASWSERTPQERQEMLDSIQAPVREFKEVAYRSVDQPGFSIDGDTLTLWFDHPTAGRVGKPIAKLLSNDPHDRDVLLTRLGVRPK